MTELENPPIEEVKDFVLDKEELESLQLESNISPERLKELRNFVVDANKKVLENLGDYITNPIPEEEIVNKFIFLDKNTYEVFSNEWVKKSGARYTPEGETGSARAYIYDGEFIIFNTDDHEVWNDLSESSKEKFIKSNGGNESEAKKFVDDAFIINTSIHEITHLYQNGEKLPLWLIESQAYWAGRELADEDNRVSMGSFDKPADFYQSLIDKYGEEKMNGLLLSRDNPENFDGEFLYWDLEDEFTEEVQKRIFPDYREN